MEPSSISNVTVSFNQAVVHSSDYASQPDIHIRCSDKWTTPAWGPEAETATGIEGVYRADDGGLYTFEDRAYVDEESGLTVPSKVTCPACIAMIAKK